CGAGDRLAASSTTQPPVRSASASTASGALERAATTSPSRRSQRSASTWKSGNAMPGSERNGAGEPSSASATPRQPTVSKYVSEAAPASATCLALASVQAAPASEAWRGSTWLGSSSGPGSGSGPVATGLKRWLNVIGVTRSEERRVGKEWRCGGDGHRRDE